MRGRERQQVVAVAEADLDGARCVRRTARAPSTLHPKATPYFGHSAVSARSARRDPAAAGHEGADRAWMFGAVMSGADLTARQGARSWYKPARCGSGPPEKGGCNVEVAVVGIIALAGVCGAAYADERPRAEEPSHAVEQPGPAALLTSQLCRIDIKGEKKDQWMRLAEGRRARSPSIALASAASHSTTAPPPAR